MKFQFIKYIQPTWYYNLQCFNGKNGYGVDYSDLNEEEKNAIDFDPNYSSESISKLDAAYQALYKGIIEIEPKPKPTSSNYISPRLTDEYYFVRKYFKSIWSIYVLVIRLLTFHNPSKEISAYLKSKKKKKINLYNSIYLNNSFNDYKSPLVFANPPVSIIIPTLNRYSYLKNILEDFEFQDYKNFDIFIVDQSEPFIKDFYKNFKLNIHIINQKEKALWLARNTAIKMSGSEFILLSEDDVRIPKNFISNHLKCIDFFNCDVSNGVFFPEEKSIPHEKSFFKYSDQFATGNALVKKRIFNDIGLFDRQFEGQRGGDGEFGLRCYLAGYKMVSNPIAYCKDVKAPVGGLRQMGSWDAFRPVKYLSPRPIPSVNYYARKYFGTKSAILNLLISLPSSIINYKFKRNKKMIALGYFIFLFTLPILIYPILKSWHLSSKMLREKAKIEYL